MNRVRKTLKSLGNELCLINHLDFVPPKICHWTFARPKNLSWSCARPEFGAGLFLEQKNIEESLLLCVKIRSQVNYFMDFVSRKKWITKIVSSYCQTMCQASLFMSLLFLHQRFYVQIYNGSRLLIKYSACMFLNFFR